MIRHQDKSEVDRKHVLVVDDEEPIRTMVSNVLRRLHLTCDTAHDGMAALEQLARNAYDVLLVDLMMPRLDGLGLVEKVRERVPPEQRPIVIVMTASPDLPDLPAFGDIVHAVVPKPFDIHELGAIVSDCVSSRRGSRS